MPLEVTLALPEDRFVGTLRAASAPPNNQRRPAKVGANLDFKTGSIARFETGVE
jgi:hypothetical protein